MSDCVQTVLRQVFLLGLFVGMTTACGGASGLREPGPNPPEARVTSGTRLSAGVLSEGVLAEASGWLVVEIENSRYLELELPPWIAELLELPDAVGGTYAMLKPLLSSEYLPPAGLAVASLYPLSLLSFMSEVSELDAALARDQLPEQGPGPSSVEGIRWGVRLALESRDPEAHLISVETLFKGAFELEVLEQTLVSGHVARLSSGVGGALAWMWMRPGADALLLDVIWPETEMTLDAAVALWESLEPGLPRGLRLPESRLHLSLRHALVRGSLLLLETEIQLAKSQPEAWTVEILNYAQELLSGPEALRPEELVIELELEPVSGRFSVVVESRLAGSAAGLVELFEVPIARPRLGSSELYVEFNGQLTGALPKGAGALELLELSLPLDKIGQLQAALFGVLWSLPGIVMGSAPLWLPSLQGTGFEVIPSFTLMVPGELAEEGGGGPPEVSDYVFAVAGSTEDRAALAAALSCLAGGFDRQPCNLLKMPEAGEPLGVSEHDGAAFHYDLRQEALGWLGISGVRPELVERAFRQGLVPSARLLSVCMSGGLLDELSNELFFLGGLSLRGIQLDITLQEYGLVWRLDMLEDRAEASDGPERRSVCPVR